MSQWEDWRFEVRVVVIFLVVVVVGGGGDIHLSLDGERDTLRS